MNLESFFLALFVERVGAETESLIMLIARPRPQLVWSVPWAKNDLRLRGPYTFRRSEPLETAPRLPTLQGITRNRIPGVFACSRFDECKG